MFSFCSIPWNHVGSREPWLRSARGKAVAAWLLLLIALPAMAQDQEKVEHPGVLKRMATMNMAKAALAPLVDMMAGRILFDETQARSSRRALTRALRDIPRRFRKPHEDPLSNASDDIWAYWDTFSLRARSARQAARRLRTGNLNGLRQTLPEMVNACLACHDTFRKPP